MTTRTEQALREALAFDPQTPALPAAPIIEAAEHQRRRAHWTMAAAASVVIALGGIAVATWSDGRPVDVVPADVTSVSGTFDIGMGWEMAVDGRALCLANRTRTVYDCVQDPTFRDGSTLSWSHGGSGPQISVWVVRDSTATAALEKPMAGMIPAQVYRVPELDVSVAVVQLLPQDPTGWERVSRNEEGEVTDSVPFWVDGEPTVG